MEKVAKNGRKVKGIALPFCCFFPFMKTGNGRLRYGWRGKQVLSQFSTSIETHGVFNCFVSGSVELMTSTQKRMLRYTLQYD